MATTFTTPNMGMVVPVVGQELGPQWAIDEFNIFVNVLDTHNHTSGKGVLVPTAGLNINADLGFGSFNATALRSTRYAAQGSPLALGPDVGCTYVSGQDLWYNDTTGRQIRLTNTGNANFSFLAYPERTPAISGNFTILATDQFNLYYVDTSGGVATVNLPATSGVAVGRTYLFVDIKRNASTNNITVVPNGADKINTVAGNFVISTNGIYTVFTTDGVGNWYANTYGGFDPLNMVTNLQWITGQSNPTLTQSGTGPANGAAQSITVVPQAPNATNGTPGSFLVNSAAPTGTGTTPTFQFQVGGTMYVQLDRALGHGCIRFDGGTTGSNVGNFMSGVGPQLLLGAGSAGMLFQVDGVGASLMSLTSSWTLAATLTAAQFFGGGVGVGGGSNVITVANRATAPTSNPSGGFIKYAESGAEKTRGSGGAITTMAAAGAGTQNTQAGIVDASLTFARTTTTGATFTVDTPVPTNTSIYLRIVTVGRLVSGTGTVGDTGMKVLEVLAKNIAGTVTVVGTANPTTFNDTNFNMGSTAAANSTNVRLTVTAPSNEGATPTIDWEVWIIPVVD